MLQAWTYYEQVHACRKNLLIHIVAVPLFDAAFLSVLWYLYVGHYTTAGAALLFALLAMILQKKGHADEEQPPTPFAGPADFLRRWFIEQFLQFPLFVLSGRWAKQYKRAA